MLIFDRLLHTDPPEGEEVNLVRLPFDARQRSRLRITIEDGPAAGQAAGIDLPRGTVTRGGALLADGHGRWLRVGAQPEALLAVRAAAGASLAALAYHLGNRHVPVEIAGDTLYLADDHVLAGMVTGLGGTVERVTRPFEPEGGAYGGHDHAHGRGHAHGHDHDHDHDHGHAHGHLHGHEHGHEHGHPHAHENADDPGLADAAGPGHRHGPAHDPAPPDRRHSPRIHDLSAEVRR